jgi:hypothetical protein
MSLRSKRGVTIGAFALLVASPFIGEYFWYGFRDAHTEDALCVGIVRKHYPLRHWQWSGIFPAYGGFIPDPHFLCSQLVAAPESIQLLLDDATASFQIIDVNPFFEDNSQEIVLVIQSRSRAFEYGLGFPDKARTRAVLTPIYPSARMLPYKGRIAVLVDFSGGVQGYYLVELPLSTGRKLPLYALNSETGKDITSTFASLINADDLREHFCGHRNSSFLAFYTMFRSGSQLEARTRDDAVTARYREFWRDK